MNAARILRALTDGDVRFIVVGGIAAVAQVAPVVTFDVDVVHDLSPEKVRRLLSLETILEIKRASRRTKDQAVVPHLEAVLGRDSR